MNFELTEGELSRCLGERYLLVLVAECLGASPRVHVPNPSRMLDSGDLRHEPLRYRVFRSAPSRAEEHGPTATLAGADQGRDQGQAG